MVLHRGRRGQKVEPELALQPLLDDLHVQKAQKAHAEAEAEGMRGLGLPHERRVVQRQLLQRLLQGLVLVAVDGKQAREHHGLRLAVAGKGLVHAAVGHGDRVAHLHLAHILEARDEVAHLAHIECLLGHLLGVPRAHLFYERLRARGHHADLVALLDATVDHADEGHHAAVGVEVAVEDERAQGGRAVALGGRDVVDHGFQKIVDTLAGLARGEHRVVGGNGQAGLDLGLHALGLGGRQVDLVDERDDLQIGVHGEHRVGHGLRLHALGGVHHEHGSVAGGQAAGDLVGEVHVARRVDEVQLVGLAVVGGVAHAHGLALDGDAALALDVHGVEQLGLHVALGHRARKLQDAVRERGLAVIDVRDDREVADMGKLVGHNVFLIGVGLTGRAGPRGPSPLSMCASREDSGPQDHFLRRAHGNLWYSTALCIQRYVHAVIPPPNLQTWLRFKITVAGGFPRHSVSGLRKRRNPAAFRFARWPAAGYTAARSCRWIPPKMGNDRTRKG